MREEVDQAIAKGKTEALVKLLKGARAADLRYAVKRVLHTVDGGGTLLQLATEWAIRPEPSSRQIACGLLAGVHTRHPSKSCALLLELVNDPDWTVREFAGQTCGDLLRKNFPKMLRTLEKWREHPSEKVRRAIAVAAMQAGRTRRLEWAEPLLKLLEPLLNDRHPYVRRNLGPFALGSGLLRAYPDMTFEYLAKWSTSNDEQVLWNVAMAFSSSGGPLMTKKALIILRKLSLDDRHYVRRAVASAMWKLGRKKPEIVRPELSRWLDDERRKHVAQEALKHL
jgi:3-methyladenine DNA glycosylase AlkC